MGATKLDGVGKASQNDVNSTFDRYMLTAAHTMGNGIKGAYGARQRCCQC
jgi:hypothetical protein